MKIAIDISQSIYGTGVSVYTKFLIKNLLRIDKKNQYLLFGGSFRKFKVLKNIVKDICLDSSNCKTKFIPVSPKISDVLFNKIHFLPIETFIGKVDIFHSSDWTQPKSKAFKVTTIHDLAPIFMPQFTPREIVEVHKNRLKRVFNEVNRIIVPSNFTKNELLRLGFPDEKIKVIYEAAGKIFKPQSSKKVSKLKKRFKINENYVMTVGIGKRKNTEGIIKGFELAKAGKDLTLVIVGNSDASKGTKRGIRYVGMPEDIDLATLYSGARALIYPSFYEGFGIPILQAFSCNCPVVTSNITSMPEIAGDAAILVNPKDTNSIAEGIKKALSAPKTYIAKGKKRVKEFSWEKTAKETLEIYKESGGII
ncbi:glycosyltransferase family 4 protein [Patescibacteria group bacterium]